MKKVLGMDSAIDGSESGVEIPGRFYATCRPAGDCVYCFEMHTRRILGHGIEHVAQYPEPYSSTVF